MTALCDTLLVSRAGFYAWRREAESARAGRDRELMPLVRDVFWHHKRRYGARRIAVELSARGQPCGVDRVAKLLKIQGLRAIQPKSFVPKTTDSRHMLGYSPNLLADAAPHGTQSSLGRRHHVHSSEDRRIRLPGLAHGSVLAAHHRLGPGRADDRAARSRNVASCDPRPAAGTRPDPPHRSRRPVRRPCTAPCSAAPQSARV